MKQLFCLMLAALGFVPVCSAEHSSDHWPIREQETIRRTLSLAGLPIRMLVENIDGYVHVTGTSESQVRVTARKVIRADSDSDLAQAKSEVKLDFSEQPGVVSISYNAPWVCRGEFARGQNSGCHDGQRRFYNVTYDIDIEVPIAARPVVSTVNNGDIRLDDIVGDFEISNVNGGITMTRIAGSGRAHTVNGPITVRFAENPVAACSFQSINGQIDTYFPSDLSAELRFKTFNGQIFSDFDVMPVALPQPNGDRQGTRFVYRSNGLQGARAGKGGPELTFDAFNGNIRLHRAGQAVAVNGASHNE